jgi:hypothetical protein
MLLEDLVELIRDDASHGGLHQHGKGAFAEKFVTLQPSEVDLGGWSGIGLFL